MSNREKIEDRIKKLLELANSANEHEANLALQRASELMMEHGVSEGDLIDSPFKGEPGQEYIFQQSREVFNIALMQIMARAFGGRIININENYKHHLFGTDAIRSTIKAMYEYSMSTIDRLTEAEMASPQDLPPFAKAGAKTKYKNRFRSGIAFGMIETLTGIRDKNRRETSGSNEFGLMVLNSWKKTDALVNKEYPKLGHSSRRSSTFGGAGFSAGKTAGRNVGFNKQAGGGSQKRLN